MINNMQKIYLLTLDLILGKQISSKRELFDFLLDKSKLTKKASITIIDALLENSFLINNNTYQWVFMLEL